MPWRNLGSNMVTCPQNCWNLTAALLPFLLTNVKEIELQKVSLNEFKVLRLFVNQLTADDKYSLLYCDNLMQPIRIQLSTKQRTFSDLFSLFLKSSLNFGHFEKNMNLIADAFTKIRTPKSVARQMCKKSHMRRPYDKQHSKQSQTLLKFARKHLYHIN